MTGINVGHSIHDYSDVAVDPSGVNEPSQQTRDAILVVDVDHFTARALLFDMVEGAPRFVAVGVSHSTAAPPVGDPTVGVAEAIRDLELQTGRTLVDGEQFITPQRSNGDGIDACYLTGMPEPPIRAALVTVGESDLRRLLVAAARRTPTILADSAEDLTGEDGALSPAALRDWLEMARPEMVVLLGAGGTADDWTVILDAVTDLARDGELKQGIVVADDARQQQAAAALGNSLDLSGIDPSEVDALEIAGALEAELRAAYASRVTEGAGVRLLASATFVDRLQGVAAVTAFLNRRMGRNVLAVGMSEGTVLKGAVDGRGVAVHRADRDLALGVRALLEVSPDEVLRWLPARSSSEEIAAWILNRALRPFTVLESLGDRLMAAALRRELVARLVREAGLPAEPDVDLIVTGPCLPGEDLTLTALTLLDAIQPSPSAGVVSLAADLEGMMAAAGAVANVDPAYAREVLEHDFLTPLASCVIVTGAAPEGALAVRGELRREGGESTRFSVPAGSLHRIPLPEGEGVTLILEPEPGFAVGRREPGEAVHLEGEQQIFGGELGIIIDARGRPFSLPEERDARVARLNSWLADLGLPTE